MRTPSAVKFTGASLSRLGESTKYEPISILASTLNRHRSHVPDQPLQRLVRLSAHDAEAAGREGRHAGHSGLARAGPVAVHGRGEAPLFEHLPGLVRRQPKLPSHLDQ